MYWVFVLILFLSSKGFAAEAGNNSPDKWVGQLIQLQSTYQKLENIIDSALQDYQHAVAEGTVVYPFEETLFREGEKKISVDRAHIAYSNEKKYYDFIATIWEQKNNKWERIAEVEWDSTKTGTLPGPEASSLWSPFFAIESNEIFSNPNHFYRGTAQFINTNPPSERGYAEFFQDLNKGSLKISTSVAEGSAEIPLSQVNQDNVQIIFGLNSYTYLTINQAPFCKNPRGEWARENSREWETECAPLFDNSQWNGFSSTLLPSSYQSLLKGSAAD